MQTNAKEISPDLAPEAARFKNEVHFGTLTGRFAGLGSKGEAFFFRPRGVGRFGYLEKTASDGP
jgi:hypothetical protein